MKIFHLLCVVTLTTCVSLPGVCEPVHDAYGASNFLALGKRATLLGSDMSTVGKTLASGLSTTHFDAYVEERSQVDCLDRLIGIVDSLQGRMATLTVSLSLADSAVAEFYRTSALDYARLWANTISTGLADDSQHVSEVRTTCAKSPIIFDMVQKASALLDDTRAELRKHHLPPEVQDTLPRT